jgi:hypothetical protein
MASEVSGGDDRGPGSSLNVTYGQYEVSSPYAVPDDPAPESADGLTAGEEIRMIVLSGTESGPVGLELRVESHDCVPIAVASPWEMIAERDVRFTTPVVMASNIMHPEESLHRSLPAPGLYRVRVHVRGRLAGHERSIVTADPPEHHLVVVRPAASPTPPAVLYGPDPYSKMILAT